MLTKLKAAVENKIKSLNVSEKSLIVLKGVKLSLFENVDVDLKKITDDKLSYFIENLRGLNRKIISYEEYLLMKVYILAQYEKIYIIDNNLFIKVYPIAKYFSDDVCKGLLTHFTESDSENDDSEIGEIDEVISIYSGLEDGGSFLIAAYYEEIGTDDPKIYRVNLFDDAAFKITDTDTATDFVEIANEVDYVNFIAEVFKNNGGTFNLRISNYGDDVKTLKRHLAILAENFSDSVTLHFVKETAAIKFETRPEYLELLKKYWGKDTFREFQVYDMAALENGKKVLRTISQEQVISDLVQQVENCADYQKEPRDLFFTAPTGAGKSAIFQIAAMYLAEHEKNTDDGLGLFTIIISPLVALMNDMVFNLKFKKYAAAATMTGETSQIVRDEIKRDIAAGKYHMLYIAPEMLLSRSSIEQLIGNRTIGMIVIDEAHIVTTWGKQFRPDYWFLGDHIRKLRKNQQQAKGRSFVIATFTATAIYHGIEDMYSETRDSLHMIDPLTYLGYVKRDDIEIKIAKVAKDKGEKHEYLTDKFDHLESKLKSAVMRKKKTLVYFPMIKLISQAYEYINSRKNQNGGLVDYITRYYGTMDKEIKNESSENFRTGKKRIMFATKAFGMGIDISDIEQIIHFAPTGNVCDYVQEIGRAARDPNLNGLAYYQYDTKDFRHINRLHGMSCIKKYQIVGVIKKIYELYRESLKSQDARFTKKRNSLLLDVENFTYLFSNGYDDNSVINNVKTALLMFQKDFEVKLHYPPIIVRPIPLFSTGFFKIAPSVQQNLLNDYPACLKVINSKKNICRVNLNDIWRKSYQDYSFPQFKYLLYTKNADLDFNQHFSMEQALCVTVALDNNYDKNFHDVINALRKIISAGSRQNVQLSANDITQDLKNVLKISEYKAESICNVFLSSLEPYNAFNNKMNAVASRYVSNSGEARYSFQSGIYDYFKWLERLFNKVLVELKESDNNEIYLASTGRNDVKEYTTALGILETFGVLTFNMLGGANSQLYIYINQYRYLKEIADNPARYNNTLIKKVADRHNLAVKMLTYIYENNFSSADIWEILEDYFLGKIPAKVLTP